MVQNGNHPGWSCLCGALLASAVFTSPALHAQTQQIERPAITTVATDLGRIQSAAPITLTVHLKMHDQKAFDTAVKDLYTPGSPTYHHWMTNSQIAGFGPSADEVQSVVSALRSNGLAVLSAAPDNLSIRVRGSAEAVETAFQTQIHQFKHRGRTFHANVTPATLAGPAGSLVRGVTGLTKLPMRSNLKYQVNPKTGQRITPSQATGGGFSSIATNN